MKSGFYLVGVLQGFRTVKFTNRETGETRDRHTIGVQLQEPNGYGGFNTSTQDIKVDERLANGTFISSLDKFKNKSVMVLVSPREWVMENGKKGITYNFDENSLIEEVNKLDS